MTYRRVIPRDLFNESNLLKCVGKLCIELEKIGYENELLFDEDEATYFQVRQEIHSGWTYMQNIYFVWDNVRYGLVRPLNSRDTWPLYLSARALEDGPMQLFDEAGKLTDEFLDHFFGEDSYKEYRAR